jgi:hypothetical protein
MFKPLGFIAPKTLNYLALILFKVVLNNINQTKPSTYVILYQLITDNPLRTSQFIIIWIKYHMLYCTFKVLCIVMLYEKHTWFSVDNYYYCIIIISSSSSSMPMSELSHKPIEQS